MSCVSIKQAQKCLLDLWCSNIPILTTTLWQVLLRKSLKYLTEELLLWCLRVIPEQLKTKIRHDFVVSFKLDHLSQDVSAHFWIAQYLSQ